MTPEAQLLQLYQQWRALTQAEAVAIQQANWARLLETQNQKKSLQERIEKAEQTLSEGRAGCPQHAAGKDQFKETLHELILLEQQNAAALAGRQQELQLEQRQLDKSRGNLRQLQRAYSSIPSAVWQSYS
jgi:hypothetical protein